MSQGNDFANYSSASNAGSGGSDEVWFVAVASDDIKQMTIDQLDEAFRLGVITGDTPVWTEGMEAWSPLSQVADLDAESGSESNGAGEAAPVAAPSNTGAFAAASGYGAVTLQSVQHSFVPGPSSVAPVTASYAPSAQVGHSSVPLSIGNDDDLPPVKRGAMRPARWALAGAAAVIVIGVVAYNSLSSSASAAGTEAAAPAPSLAARPYDGAEGAERGAAANHAAAEHAAAAPAAEANNRGTESSGTAAVTSAAAAASTTAKAALVAPSEEESDEPGASKKGADRDSLRNNFSKSLSKKEKASAKASKVKPRKTASRAATKSRATKAPKKSTVVRTQSAFDPLNDSLP